MAKSKGGMDALSAGVGLEVKKSIPLAHSVLLHL